MSDEARSILPAIEALSDRMDGLGTRFDRLSARVDEGFALAGSRLDRLTHAVEELEGKADRLRDDMAGVKNRLAGNEIAVGALATGIGGLLGIRGGANQRMDRPDARLALIEKRLDLRDR